MSDIEGVARRTLADINPNLTIVKFQTFDSQIADRFNDDRMIPSVDTEVRFRTCPTILCMAAALYFET